MKREAVLYGSALSEIEPNVSVISILEKDTDVVFLDRRGKSFICLVDGKSVWLNVKFLDLSQEENHVSSCV